MKVPRAKVLSVAVASGRIGMAFFVDQALMDWDLSVKGSRSQAQAQDLIRRWYSFYQPDVVVVEKLGPQTRKSGRTSLIRKRPLWALWR